MEEITKDMFDKFKAKFTKEKEDIEKELAKFGNRVSNLDLYIDTAFRTTSKLAPEWASADYNDRQELQYMVFPEGIYYNRKKDECRTPKVNEAFRYIARLARFSGEKEKRELQFELHVPSLVARTGIEPMIPTFVGSNEPNGHKKSNHFHDCLFAV